MNTISKKIVWNKEPKRHVDKRYLKFVRKLPCVIQSNFDVARCGCEVQAHHSFHGRYSHGKSGDNMAIPLAECWHTGLWGGCNSIAIHKAKETWQEKFGNDFDFVAGTRDAIEKIYGYKVKG